jgi:hypothetical protein
LFLSDLSSNLFKYFKTKYKMIPPPVPANPFHIPAVIDDTERIILFLFIIFFINSTPFRNKFNDKHYYLQRLNYKYYVLLYF